MRREQVAARRGSPVARLSVSSSPKFARQVHGQEGPMTGRRIRATSFCCITAVSTVELVLDEAAFGRISGDIVWAVGCVRCNGDKTAQVQTVRCR
ncbi:uncharacterized protein PSANT_00684 [Moesziomyces antarcticus]|uniref:Uncharacterized protein n=1 Tax=Pseudozyma antarctica TaxID=84753 RepID=A0A5C3FFI6_PSEA2|nr:uncharacterized protein PSANT_00684 [Moesziomyces antarcticus]